MEKDKLLLLLSSFLALAIIFGFLPEISRAQQLEESCITCHVALAGKLAEPVEQLKKSVHAAARVSCADCHRGDPTTTDMAKSMSKERGFVGKPSPKEIPGLCGRCHSDVSRMRPYNLRTDQYAEYRISQHGKRLFERGDTNVAVCTSCHGTHEIRKKDDPLSPVSHRQVPETCARCHSNKEKMKVYNLPTDQLEEFKESYHGQVLYGFIKEKNPALAPSCPTCHGIHGASPPGVKEVAIVCGNCHTTTATYFGQSPHFLAVQRVGMPRCINCHGNHKIEFPKPEEMFIGNKPGSCVSCHQPDSLEYARAQQLYALSKEATNALKKAEENLKSVEKAGLNVDQLRESLETARTKIVEARPISHTLNVEKVQKLTQEAVQQSEKLGGLSETVRQDVKKRKQAFALMIILLGLIVGLIYQKRKTIMKDWLKKKS